MTKQTEHLAQGETQGEVNILKKATDGNNKFNKVVVLSSVLNNVCAEVCFILLPTQRFKRFRQVTSGDV